MMKLNEDLREFIASLNSTKVNYLIVGGHAVAFHGRPRFTADFDFFIDRSADNAARLAEVMSKLGFAALGLKAADFRQEGVVVQLGRPQDIADAAELDP